MQKGTAATQRNVGIIKRAIRITEVLGHPYGTGEGSGIIRSYVDTDQGLNITYTALYDVEEGPDVDIEYRGEKVFSSQGKNVKIHALGEWKEKFDSTYIIALEKYPAMKKKIRRENEQWCLKSPAI